MQIQKNDVITDENGIVLRILEVRENESFVVECNKKRMPYWISNEVILEYQQYELAEINDVTEESATSIMHRRYTMIADILPVMVDEKLRCDAIADASVQYGISKQTIRSYLWMYLVAQDKKALAPNIKKIDNKELTLDEKNMRWALNKFFYSMNKNSLSGAYKMMLHAKYCDNEGKLNLSYPSFHQFRYFYRKTKKQQNYIISRYGLKKYQRDKRPCIGDSVQSFASAPGVGMLDSTVCDIYLVDDAGNVVGRPILTACVDAYSGLCCGYTLTWEGGVYSLRELMLNVIKDKTTYCKEFGIHISENEWPSKQLMGRFVTDMGKEYCTDTFAQLSELGVTITSLPAYRPELKGPVERFFKMIQDYYKPHLKGKGIIEPDFQERGVKDYRKSACLNLREFEIIVLRCIILYNSKRIIKDFPYDEMMLKNKVRPHSNTIWNWGITLPGVNLIDASEKKLVLTLLPRTKGRFNRFGLNVNKLRYYNSIFTEEYLTGADSVVAYNPDDVSNIWLITNDSQYIRFDLIESRFNGKRLAMVQEAQEEQKKLVSMEKEDNLQAEIDLVVHIQAITSNVIDSGNKNTKDIRNNRKKEVGMQHRNIAGEVIKHGE
ncbi:Mu transposase, C-terminal [Anaerosporobacter mobilis DSM 15930]|jgi:hypothetical protein|uniref:Mu transposase, C-terminal n=1 Tax=Anaerosporobacter mobilis DSM 15930 TaxID=1120996 RepID=A0A1M7NAV8_9FIRM|nr:Mu transposase C-terminal domain-containing protein [Anaerosporobacter mobilis]SHN00788.1 Mu transposase, C-terminal [Anaerosporobacter mobilis DSM 15930]